MIHGISSIRFVACQSRNNFASTGRQGFKVVGGRVFTGTWFHSPVYLNTSGKMEMYLDDSSSERKIIWHILKVGIPLELLKPPPASSLPGARPRGGRTARSRQGVARAPWCQVKRFLLERRTGLIEDLPKSIPMFDFFFFVDQGILCVEFLKISICFLTGYDENRKMHLEDGFVL